MRDNGIKRENLLPKLRNLKQRDWLKAAHRLEVIHDELLLDIEGGSGSHAILRDKSLPIDHPDSPVATFATNLFYEANKSNFQHILDHGIPEDDIWRALKLLK